MSRLWKGLAGTLALLATGCAAPLVGTWRGTMDLGPVAAHDLQVVVDHEGQTGRVVVQEAGKAFTHLQLCSVRTLDKRQVELVYDANRPNCEAKGSDPSERRTFRGTVGEGVLFGDVLQGEERIGFFRVFRHEASSQGETTPRADPSPQTEPAPVSDPAPQADRSADRPPR